MRLVLGAKVAAAARCGRAQARRQKRLSTRCATPGSQRQAGRGSRRCSKETAKEPADRPAIALLCAPPAARSAPPSCAALALEYRFIMMSLMWVCRRRCSKLQHEDVPPPEQAAPCSAGMHRSQQQPWQQPGGCTPLLHASACQVRAEGAPAAPCRYPRPAWSQTGRCAARPPRAS